jgi:DNA-directed RNA polymerase specialized sigma54-like protein
MTYHELRKRLSLRQKITRKREMWRMAATGMMLKAIAMQVGFHISTVSRILNGKR